MQWRKFLISLSKSLFLNSIAVAKTQLFDKLLQLILICLCNRSNNFNIRIRPPFTRVFHFFFHVSPAFWVVWKLKTLNSLFNVHFPMPLYLFLTFLEVAFKADLRKGILALMNDPLIFLFYLIRRSILGVMLVFGLMVFSRKWLWMLMMVSVRMLPALMMIFNLDPDFWK